MTVKHWLMKAEPDSRVVKGKDVKFSVDDFEAARTTAWEGVRNHEAKNLMKEMKIGDKVLFYHSNCKNPGIAGFAEVSKEAYPDYTAWDPAHPYYDAKADKDDPRWYMVELTFSARTGHFIPLTLIKRIAALPTQEPPADIAYIGSDGVAAIKGMALVNRGRLSVQRVQQETWDVVCLLAEKGGWEEGAGGKAAAKTRVKAEAPEGGKKKTRKKARKAEVSSEGELEGASGDDDAEPGGGAAREGVAANKRKVETLGDDEETPRRRSARTRK